MTPRWQLRWVTALDSGGTKTYRRDGTYVTDSVLSDGSATYTPGVPERRSGNSKFAHLDYLGSLKEETNAGQGTSTTRSYDAFGNILSTTGTVRTPFGFAGGWGYQEDGDSGLKVLGHRYYDSSTGRFLTRDPAQDGRNWYVYCDNNPLSWVDPPGLNPLDWLKDKWYSWTVAKAPVDMIKPAASGIAGGVILWGIWELADHARGNHRPKGWKPKQPGIHPPHGLPGVSGPSSLPGHSWGRIRNRKSIEYWSDPDR